MSVSGGKDKHKLVAPQKDVLDLTPLTFKRGEKTIEVFIHQKRKSLISIIENCLNYNLCSYIVTIYHLCRRKNLPKCLSSLLV
jgi:hypothetical protein